MRHDFWFYLCSVFTLLTANCFVPSQAYGNLNATVTNVQIQGTLTYQGNATVTVTISRTSDLNDFSVAVTCNPPLSDIDRLGCANGGVAFPAGVNTVTTTVWANPTKSSENSTLWFAASTGQDSSGFVVGFNDPGITVGVTIAPVTVSAAVTPNVVPPGGPSPELSFTMKNSNGAIVHYGSGLTNFGTWDCSTTAFLNLNWDSTTNPNVTAQTGLPLLQAPFTQVCNIQLPFNLWDGQILLTLSVTYQEAPNNADLGPSCPRSGSEGTCGSPITLTNGNTWTQADDYELPGLGGGISLRRMWNSQWSSYQGWILAGMFGDSWQSNYEKHIQALSSSQLLYWRGDGSSWFFTSPSKGTWALSTPVDERATLTFSNKTGYTITLRDGSVELYDTNGNLTSLQDRNGNKATVTYDTTSFHRVTKVTDAAGRVLTFTYGSATLPKQVTSIQDSVGTIATYSYDSGSHLTSVTYADNSVLNYNYDRNGLLLSITDQLAKILEAHTYDSVRRGLTSQRANGVDSLTVNYYDGTSIDGVETLTDSNGNSTNYLANQRLGNRWYMTNIQGTGCDSCVGRNNQTFAYDATGNRTSSADPNGNQTTYSYDTNGNVAQISKNLGTSTQTSNFTWNSFGEVLTATDPLSKVTTNTYDTKGNMLTTKTPVGNATTFTYDTKGELLTIKDPLLNVTTLTYTTVGLIASIKDAQSHLTQFQYDARGNRTLVIDALNQTTSYTYDSRNRLTKITYPTSPATTVQFAYDYRGRRTSVTDANNKVTQYGYDDADRLVTVTDAANNVTTYAYDTENNLTSITDAATNKTSFTYDPLGRVTQTLFPSNLTETYGYDSNGNLTSKIDRKNQKIVYAYDPANRLSSKTYPDNSSVAYTYDLANHLTQAVDPTGTYGFTFDADGRLTQTSTAYTFITGKTFTVGYGYDAAANRNSMTDPQNAGTTYVYDTLNRLSSLTSPQGAFGFTYDALSRRTQLTRPNNVATNYAYDSLSRLQSVLHQLSGSTIDGATYTVDNAGNRASKTDKLANVTSNYAYDPIYQLTGVNQGGPTTESYTYDLVGNRLTSATGSYAYNTSNELTSSPTATFTFDNNGNTLTKADSTGTTSYAWDFENRLTSVTLPGTAGTVSFRYDPFGRRIQKSSSSATTNFLYDGSNSLEEVDTSGNVLARYTGTQSTDEPLATLRAGVTSYYQADGPGSITSLSSTTGTLANTYTYDSFGNLTASSGTTTNPFRYTAREFDSETNLYFYRARYYDPTAGRFINEDPIAVNGGVNFYRYVGNSPPNYVDAFGLTPNSIGSIKGDMNTALNIMAKPNCADFILNTLRKAWDQANQRALKGGFVPSASTLKGQADDLTIGAFALTLLESQIVISSSNPEYSAHVGFAGSNTIQIDPGYGGPLTLIHETFHLAPYGFTDTELAGALGAQFTHVPGNTPKSMQKTMDNASKAWDCLLRKACQ